MRKELQFAIACFISISGIFSVPAFAQYAGPAIISRGEAPKALDMPQVKFQPFVELTADYSTGLAGVTLTNTGDLANQSSAGMGLAWGVSGHHSWKRTRVGLAYRGSLDHNFKRTYYDSINQSLLLGVNQQITRHIGMVISSAAGVFSRDFGLLGLPQTVPFDPSTNHIPTTDFFDNRTIYGSVTGGLNIQRSARLSFHMGGNAYISRRRSTALHGDLGEGAQGDVQYRLTRRETIGAGYTFARMEHTNVFGDTNVHSFFGTFSHALSARTEFSGSGGVARVEIKALQSVPIDPVVAALLGISSSPQLYHQTFATPVMSARLAHVLPRGVLYVSAARSIVPGNGLFLTSTATSVTAGYSYTGLRRWSFNTAALYSTAEAFGQVQGRYGGVSGTASMSRKLIGSLHFLASFSARQYQSSSFDKYNRLIYGASVGLGFTPGDVPLRIW